VGERMTTNQRERIMAHRYANDIANSRVFMRGGLQRLCSYCKRIPVGRVWLYGKRDWQDREKEKITDSICPACKKIELKRKITPEEREYFENLKKEMMEKK
jgi:hypothetical protein